MAPVVELDSRSSGNLDVTLLWDPEDGAIVVQVIDWASDDDFSVPVDPAKALDAFQHPYAYADVATGGLEPAIGPVSAAGHGPRRER